MVAIIRTEWSGTSGGPGLTQMAVMGAAGGEWNPDGAQSAVNAVRNFWLSLASLLPDELRLTTMPTVDTYDTATGELSSSATAAIPPSTVAGTSASGYAGGAGCKVTWQTGQIRNGRRVRGSTFIVPLSAAAFTGTGTIGSTQQTTINNAATALLAALTAGGTSLAVWSRPLILPNPRAGFQTQVISGICSSKSAILRGRRD